MSRGINNVLLIGTMARNPELKYTPKGIAVLEFTVAGDSRTVGSDGLERNVPFYQRSSIYGKNAEALAETLKAGDAVLLEGNLEYQAWETEDGTKRSKVVVRTSRLESLQSGWRNAALVTDAIGGLRLPDAVNEVTILGNLTKDAVSRVTPNGNNVTNLSVAVNESWRDENNVWQNKAHYVEVTVWGDMAALSANLTKGESVLVAGHLTNDSWTDLHGQKRTATKIEAHRLEMLMRAPKPQEAAAVQAPAPQRSSKAAPKSSGKGRQTPASSSALSEDMPF
jgi:single-strand DNA-binding protein